MLELFQNYFAKYFKQDTSVKWNFPLFLFHWKLLWKGPKESEEQGIFSANI